MQLPTSGARYFFFFLLAVIAVLSYFVISPVFNAVAFAFLTSLIFQPVYAYISRFTKKRTRLASITTMIVIFLTFLLPLILLTQLTLQQVIQFNQDIRALTTNHDLTLETSVTIINENLERFGLARQQITVADAQRTIDETVSSLARIILNAVVQTSGRTLEIFAQFFIYLFLLYFLLPLQNKIPNAVVKVSPLSNDIDRMFLTRTTEMAKSMIRGTLVIAVVQSVMSGLLLAFFGVPYVVFWVMLMIFLGVMPVVGPSLIMIPAGIIFLLMGNYVAGAVILVLNITVISNIDNFLRPKLVSKLAQLHPALVLIGVLGGLKAFGVLGVIYGPVIMILLTSMIQVYQATRPEAEQIT